MQTSDPGPRTTASSTPKSLNTLRASPHFRRSAWMATAHAYQDPAAPARVRVAVNSAHLQPAFFRDLRAFEVGGEQFRRWERVIKPKH